MINYRGILSLAVYHIARPCKYCLTQNLFIVYKTLQRKNGMQYRRRCNILTHSEMLCFLGIFIKED